MRKKLTIFFSLLILSAIAVFFIKPESENRACFKNHCFEVELALTPQEQAQGLMFKEELGENRGMLFVFNEEASHSFWMKNTLIPLDIIWLDKDKKVVFISENAHPCFSDNCPLIAPLQPAQYVLELNAGKADEIGLEIGDKMAF